MILRGIRNGSTANNHAQLQFENYDNDLAGSKILGGIFGNATTNVGGLLFNNYSDGSTASTAMNMSANGNFTLGNNDTLQDNYKFRNNGTTKLAGSNYILPQLRLLSYDKDSVFGGSTWGNGSSQTTITTDRTIGESFCSVSSLADSTYNANKKRILPWSSPGHSNLASNGTVVNRLYSSHLTGGTAGACTRRLFLLLLLCNLCI